MTATTWTPAFTIIDLRRYALAHSGNAELLARSANIALNNGDKAQYDELIAESNKEMMIREAIMEMVSTLEEAMEAQRYSPDVDWPSPPKPVPR